MSAKAVFWGSFAALAWTHAGYPLTAALLARVRPRPVRKADVMPDACLIVVAHNEEETIGPVVENLLSLDYPRERLDVIVGSDGSIDRTDEIVAEIAARDARLRLVRCARRGKLATTYRVYRETDREILVFSDANTRWEPDALRKLVRNFADDEVGYVCGRLVLERTEGTNREGLYWRYETWLRGHESALGSITAGYGSIYAVRRRDFVEQPYGLDNVLPALMVQRGLRAVYEPEAVVYEKPARDVEDEFVRKVRMFRGSWYHLLEGRPTRGVDPLFRFQWFSHRTLRYASGLLHLALVVASAALARRGRAYGVAFAGQLAFLSLAAAGRLRAPVPGASVAHYYVVVTWATLVGLSRYLRSGVQRVWEQAEGTR